MIARLAFLREERFVEIMRVRHFLEHNSKQITSIKSEFTVKSNREKEPLDNIFFTFSNFMPNLRIKDSECSEYPIMSNSDTLALLEIKKEQTNDHELSELIERIKSHKTFVIWIKVPPPQETASKRGKDNKSIL